MEVVFLEDGRSAQRGILVSRIRPELFRRTVHQIILTNIRPDIRYTGRQDADILPGAGYPAYDWHGTHIRW